MLDKLSDIFMYILIIICVFWFTFFPIAYCIQIKLNDELRQEILLNEYLPNFEKERLLK